MLSIYFVNSKQKSAKIHFADMSLVAYADSDDDSSDSNSPEGVLPSVAGQERSDTREDRAQEPVYVAGPAILGQ